MSALARDALTRAGWYAINNPGDIALLYLASRYAPGRVVKIAIESGKYYSRVARPTASYGANVAKIIAGPTASNIGGRILTGGRVAAGATGTAAAAVAPYLAGAIIGYGLGAAVGTGLGYTIDGSRGANAARDLYTGKVTPAMYTTTLALALSKVIDDE